MSSSEKELEEQLKDSGNTLLSPLSTTNDLLSLLDRVENLLSHVDQAPSKTMQEALLPSMKALISNELLRHSDMDVKVSVVSCITEIMRITAPDAPYNDDQMKEIFQLTVAAFEKLSHVSGHCYTKAISILDTVAKIRSSVMMLDLECDALIVEMFQHFLRVIRFNHPHTVFSAMQKIMTLVIDESEEISLDLLSPLLSSVRKENQNNSPISWKLGEEVITKCAAKLTPYLREAAKSMHISLADYAPIIASIWQIESGGLRDSDSGGDLENENKLARGAVPCEPPKEAKEIVTDAVCPRETVQTVDGISKSISNGTAPTLNDEKVTCENSSKKLQRHRPTKHFRRADSKGVSEPNNSLSTKANKSKLEPDSVPQKRGRKPNSLMNPEEGYDHSWICSGRKTPKQARHRMSNDNEINGSHSENLVSKDTSPSTLSNMTKPPGLQPKIDETKEAPSPSQNDNRTDESHHRRGRPKKGSTLNKEGDLLSPTVPKGDLLRAQIKEKTPQSVDTNSQKELEETSIVDGKAQGCLKEVRLVAKKNEENTFASGPVVAEKGATLSSHPEEKPLRQSIVKLVTEKTNDQISVPRSTMKSRKSGGDKDVIEASVSKGYTRFFEATRKISLKRKHIIGKEVTETPDEGELLVGRKIKVWWPMDKTFYEGVIHSFDPVKKKHKVSYVDGDEETLNLKKQRWELIGDHASLDEGQKTDILSPDDASYIARKRKWKPKSDQAKQTKADSSLKSRGASAKSNAKSLRLGNKSIDKKPTMKDERVNEPSATKDQVQDGGKISTSELKEDRQETSLDLKQTAPETMSLSMGDSSKDDIESSSKECAKKLTEMSKDGKNAKSE
ncbi:hypothetical protein FNV43_RR07053 [Rhamnella rubrinervis]|uniref:Uncharacterized protein n=1 Tax=Rhamnella rubrinervis TaxID=2594499 RepID=A0A8K0MM08_9ROSA|nr:hypothetical protein FNV43_RR07053 [Rhamnella rubrinervis]